MLHITTTCSAPQCNTTDMSLGYADRLSYREDLGGRLGAPEVADPPHVALQKAEQLAELVRIKNHALCTPLHSSCMHGTALNVHHSQCPDFLEATPSCCPCHAHPRYLP